jgi:hypothetical protein
MHIFYDALLEMRVESSAGSCLQLALFYTNCDSSLVVCNDIFSLLSSKL